MATEATVPNIKWDEINAHIFRPDVCRVESTQEELSFLFGSYGTGDVGQAKMTVKLLKHIIVSPFVAKRISNLLRNTLEDYESQYGPLNRDSSASIGQPGRPTPRAKLPAAGSAGTVEQGQILFQLINNLDLPYGYERSFKMYGKTLLGNRFLLTLDKNSLRQLPPERILELCGQINMPQNLLADFSENLSRASCVHFGFEENKASCIYKAYLEFSATRESDVNNRASGGSAPFLLYLGFKWDSSDNSKHTVSRYNRYPFITVENILERVSSIYGGARCPYEMVKDITDIASARISHDDIFYLEVTEDNNPRRSFDINIYNANLLIGELYPFLARIGQYYAISFGEFHGLYEGIKDRIFGHVSGGIDREGKDFLTIYHGMQTLQKQEVESPARPRARQGRLIPLTDSYFSGVESRDIKAQELFELVKGLNVPIGIEHSFKALEKSLLADRFLVAFERNSLGQKPDESMLNICRQIEMPEPFQETFLDNLSKANVVLFGLEKNQKNVVYKAYLEFGTGFKSFQKDSNNQESALLHLGFKWNVSDDSQKAVAKYRYFPMLTEKDMLERLSAKDFFKNERKGYLKIVEAILNLAICRTHPYEFTYVEAEEDSNPRTSFDINMYKANLRMKELYPFLLEIARYYSIPQQEYLKIYEASKNLIFGHIQAGIDRTGREFFTVYYGEKTILRPERK